MVNCLFPKGRGIERSRLVILVIAAELHRVFSANKSYPPIGAVCQRELSANERTRKSMKNFVAEAI